MLALTGTTSPVQRPAGQMILVMLLGPYVAALVWMRPMATGKPLPRLIGSTTPQQKASGDLTVGQLALAGLVGRAWRCRVA